MWQFAVEVFTAVFGIAVWFSLHERARTRRYVARHQRDLAAAAQLDDLSLVPGWDARDSSDDRAGVFAVR